MDRKLSRWRKAFKISWITMVACIPLGILGGLTMIWIDGTLGKKIIASSFIVGLPAMMVAWICAEALTENSEEDDGKDCEGE